MSIQFLSKILTCIAGKTRTLIIVLSKWFIDYPDSYNALPNDEKWTFVSTLDNPACKLCQYYVFLYIDYKRV